MGHSEKKDYHRLAFSCGDVVDDRYEVTREISHGGMGIVYQALDKTTGQQVALKILPVELATNRNAVEDLRREARITMKLAHPNIMQLYHFGEEGDVKYIVMEYVDGPTLEDVIERKGELSIKKTLFWARGICEGLQYAHDKGILHRDVKPANIMLHQRKIVKIMDFGIAREMQDSIHKLTDIIRIGTPPYMSPEQLMGAYMDHRGDIYSTGAVIYECLCGLPPFFEESGDLQAMLKKPRKLVNARDHVNRAVLKALNKHPENRWNSAMEFYEGLTGQREVPQDMPVEPKARKLTTARRARPPQAKPRVLVVDDESDIRVLLRAVLNVSGYLVEDARDGEEAVKQLEQHEFDLVIADIYMPNMDGIQLLKYMRRNKIMVPVVIVTASMAEKDILEGYTWGADYYITKPFDNERLLEIVSKFTRNRA